MEVAEGAGVFVGIGCLGSGRRQLIAIWTNDGLVSLFLGLSLTKDWLEQISRQSFPKGKDLVVSGMFLIINPLLMRLSTLF